MHFRLGAWYQGVLDGSPLTFQVVESSGSSLLRIKVFRTFYGGKMLTTEEWINGLDLANCEVISEPEDSGSW
jgi:hypothetical protein